MTGKCGREEGRETERQRCVLIGVRRTDSMGICLIENEIPGIKEYKSV